MTSLYTASVRATGDGRNGHVQSTDGNIDTPVRVPKEMGGEGGATNPEQLFAAGYAACFHQAIKLVGRQVKVDVTGTEIVADVSLGTTETGGFQLAVALEVTIPGIDREAALDIVERAHQVCPFSHATRGNIEVELSVA